MFWAKLSSLKIFGKKFLISILLTAKTDFYKKFCEMMFAKMEGGAYN